ncbi:MAG: type III pantothenate kinase [Chloroflexota bacterium]|nr:type III pantothenate kinase [Chloroflexota bacterium]
MLLAVDLGNTATTLGVFEGDKLRVMWNIATVLHCMPDEYAMILLNLLRHHSLDRSDIKEVAFCSTVPPLVGVWQEVFDRYFHISPLVVGAGTRTGVRIRMDFPREVGADRIVNAAAAHHLYGGPVIIVDMGTATTFDVVSKDGDYLGGAIAPGLATAAEALSTRTAQLPRVELAHPKRAIGTNTVAAMQSGLIFGYVGLVEGIVARIQQELGEKAKVVAAGGYARLIASETKVFDEVNPELTLYGLRLVYLMNKSQEAM